MCLVDDFVVLTHSDHLLPIIVTKFFIYRVAHKSLTSMFDVFPLVSSDFCAALYVIILICTWYVIKNVNRTVQVPICKG